MVIRKVGIYLKIVVVVHDCIISDEPVRSQARTLFGAFVNPDEPRRHPKLPINYTRQHFHAPRTAHTGVDSLADNLSDVRYVNVRCTFNRVQTYPHRWTEHFHPATAAHRNQLQRIGGCPAAL